MGDLHAGMTRYFAFYNGERLRQALNYQTPDVVYESGEGGSVMILDKYGSVATEETHQAKQELAAISVEPQGNLPEQEPASMIPTFTGG